jgi:hypothetical protein
VTQSVLTRRSFVARDLWRYMRRSLPDAGLPRASAVSIESEDDRCHLRVRDAQRAMIGQATVGGPVVVGGDRLRLVG